MSDFNVEDENARLPLPAPRPGTALDDKIIAYARANTPRRESRGGARWIAGLATASIVAVAVMITLPYQSPAPVIMDAEQRADPVPAPAAAAPLVMKSSRGERQEQLSEEQAMASADRAAAAAADVGEARADMTGAIRPGTAGAAEPEQPPFPANLAGELDKLGDMLAAGEKAEARETYRKLRNNCAQCELPATLEEALLRYRNNADGVESEVKP